MDLSALGLNGDTSTVAAAHDHPDTLHMLVGYEDGSVCLFQESASLPTAQGQKQKRKMQVLWSIKCHREPVLGLDVSSDLQFAVSCGSDNVLGVPEVLKEALKSNGIADIKIRSDNKIIGLAGWDGRIRIFSAKALKPLAVLKHHREGLYCLGFAQIRGLDQSANAEGAAADDQNKVETGTEKNSASALRGVDDGDGSDKDSEDESDEDSDSEYILEDRLKWSRRHWIAVGGKENRISLWEIY
ncbi:ASTRA complex subunit [Mortierella sp. AD094]|nr:ASTRA complex subunit [Mortierella sp. AD094]